MGSTDSVDRRPAHYRALDRVWTSDSEFRKILNEAVRDTWPLRQDAVDLPAKSAVMFQAQLSTGNGVCPKKMQFFDFWSFIAIHLNKPPIRFKNWCCVNAHPRPWSLYSRFLVLCENFLQIFATFLGMFQCFQRARPWVIERCLLSVQSSNAMQNLCTRIEKLNFGWLKQSKSNRVFGIEI